MFNVIADSSDGSARIGRAAPDLDRPTLRRAAGRTLRIGVIASEFPPGHGGMQEHARGLVDNLAREHRVCVYTSRGAAVEPGGRDVGVRPVLDWQLRSDLRELERDRVDAWITLNAGLAPYSLGLSAPLFAYVHGNDFTRPWHPHPDRRVRLARKFGGEGVVRRWRVRRIGAGLRGARWMFANSAFTRDLCARLYGVPAERITVVPPGMRAAFFRATDPGVSPRLRLVTVSRLATDAARKNIDGVLEAVAALRGEVELSYTVIGDGDDLPRLRALAGRLGILDRVRFLGAVATEAIIEEFGRSDGFVMAVRPSQDEVDVEGFGMVYAEAAATGLPSIGTRGIPEVIEDGVTGLLLHDVSCEGIADGLRRFQRRLHQFDRDTIRRSAQRFSAPFCTATMADAIAAMI